MDMQNRKYEIEYKFDHRPTQEELNNVYKLFSNSFNNIKVSYFLNNVEEEVCEEKE